MVKALTKGVGASQLLSLIPNHLILRPKSAGSFKKGGMQED